MRTWLISVESLWAVWASFSCIWFTLHRGHAVQHTYYADANVEAMGDLDDEKRDLFGAVFFVSEQRYIRVAVTMKQERPKGTIKDNLKVTKKKLHRLWHILFSKASSRPLSRSKVFKYQILKQYTTYTLQNGWRRKIKKQTVVVWCRPRHVSVTSGSHFHLLRDFFSDQKAECPCLPWTNEKFALKWVCNRIYRPPRCPP